mmetsp:Transcript_55021/g.116941  ORF Transcript_55021/g.116941 Transcript_55021/m.116941 type:complete len:109 (-) Transcript_55021:45-371(-)
MNVFVGVGWSVMGIRDMGWMCNIFVPVPLRFFFDDSYHIPGRLVFSSCRKERPIFGKHLAHELHGVQEQVQDRSVRGPVRGGGKKYGQGTRGGKGGAEKKASEKKREA